MTVNPIPRELISHLGIPPEPDKHAHLFVEEREDRYIIAPVPYLDSQYHVSISKQRLDNNRSHKPDEWSALLKNSRWRIPSGPLLMSLLTTLYNDRQSDCRMMIGKIKGLLRSDLNNSRISTSTRITYDPTGLDEIIHDYGTPDAHRTRANLSRCSSEESIELLLGMQDIITLQKFIRQKTRRNLHLLIPKEKLRNEKIYSLAFTIDDTFTINAMTNTYLPMRARGVILERIA